MQTFPSNKVYVPVRFTDENGKGTTVAFEESFYWATFMASRLTSTRQFNAIIRDIGKSIKRGKGHAGSRSRQIAIELSNRYSVAR